MSKTRTSAYYQTTTCTLLQICLTRCLHSRSNAGSPFPSLFHNYLPSTLLKKSISPIYPESHSSVLPCSAVKFIHSFIHSRTLNKGTIANIFHLSILLLPSPSLLSKNASYRGGKAHENKEKESTFKIYERQHYLMSFRWKYEKQVFIPYLSIL